MTPEMDENERVVREAWGHIQDTKTLLVIWSDDDKGIVAQFWAGDWAEVRAFTDQRKEELRLLDEEIALQTLYRDARQQLSDSDYDGPLRIEDVQWHVTVLGRTFLRLTGIREELSRGMKG